MANSGFGSMLNRELEESVDSDTSDIECSKPSRCCNTTEEASLFHRLFTRALMASMRKDLITSTTHTTNKQSRGENHMKTVFPRDTLGA